jgi:hypothetical protein
MSWVTWKKEYDFERDEKAIYFGISKRYICEHDGEFTLVEEPTTDNYERVSSFNLKDILKARNGSCTITPFKNIPQSWAGTCYLFMSYNPTGNEGIFARFDPMNIAGGGNISLTIISGEA